MPGIVLAVLQSRVQLYGLLLIAAGFLTSCDSPQKRGLRELAKAGIEPSGRALMEAVSQRNTQRLGWLLDVGVYTEQCDSLGRTPVRVAIENGDIPSVLKLLDANVNVNATTSDETTILGVAVERGESAIVEKLLTAGAKTEGLMPDGEKLLPWAIREGRLSSVRQMMTSGADPHLKDRMGNPLLHVAMEAGRRDLADALIELGADSAATNAVGETTIQVAFRRGWLDAVPKLAAAGADPNAPGVDGLTLLDTAIEKNDLKQIALLLRVGANPNLRRPSGDSETPFDKVFSAGNTEVLQMFLRRGTTLAKEDCDALLWKAFQRNNLEMARILLNQGASASSRGSGGTYLIEAAAWRNNGSFVKLLTDYGSPAGNALYHACSRGDLDMVSLLISCGLPVNVTRFPSSDTPLSVSIRGKHDQIAALLIENGADVSLGLPEGQTPLHLAIATGCPLTVKMLLDTGADPNSPFTLPVSTAFLKNVRPGVMRWALKNDRNVTPLMMASDSGVVMTARHLIKAGAKKSVWTKSSSLWPINFASRRNDVKMMRLFLGRDPLREVRSIEIRLSEQKAIVMDGEGKEIFTTKVSTGRKGYSTPTGEFVITNKHRDWTSTLYHASMPYFQRLSCSDFGLHQGNLPGYPASHGCIRVPAGNAARLFTMTETGDRVTIIP